MSDFHLDPQYQLGSSKGCRRPGKAGKGATRWGRYECDAPGDLILSAFSTMKGLIKMDDIAFSISTGDLVAHNDDTHVSEDLVKFDEQQVFDAVMAEMVNSHGKIPMYAALGNHDSYPEMRANEDSSWNFDFLSSMWFQNDWIGQEASNDIKTHFGAYAMSNPPGLMNLKIISLNTDFWYAKNIFNYANYSNPDPNGMLRFLISELQESERTGQRVWIIGHVPSGNGDVLPNPTALFQSIVVRFSPATIAAVFWGHTHWDQKRIYYDFAPDSLSSDGFRDTSKLDLQTPLNVGWIGPSLTPSAGPANVNPAWALYSVDNTTYSVIDAKIYYADIEKASWAWENMDGRWSQLYDARGAYDADGAWPKDAALNATFWDRYLVDKIAGDEFVAAMYAKYEVRESKPGLEEQSRCVKIGGCAQGKKCMMQAATAEMAFGCKKEK